MVNKYLCLNDDDAEEYCVPPTTEPLRLTKKVPIATKEQVPKITAQSKTTRRAAIQSLAPLKQRQQQPKSRSGSSDDDSVQASPRHHRPRGGRKVRERRDREINRLIQTMHIKRETEVVSAPVVVPQKAAEPPVSDPAVVIEPKPTPAATIVKFETYVTVPRVKSDFPLTGYTPAVVDEIQRLQQEIQRLTKVMNTYQSELWNIKRHFFPPSLFQDN